MSTCRPRALTLRVEWLLKQPLIATLLFFSLLGANPIRAAVVEAPVCSPPDGTRLPALVSLASPDTNAAVYYTLDGTVPGTNSPVYAVPLNLTQFTVIRARSFRTGFDPSDAVFAGYYPATEAAIPVTLHRQITNDWPASPLVTLTVTNPSGARCFVIEEQLPPTVQPVSVDASGQWLAARQVIRWGPFLDTTNVVASYRLLGLAGDHTVTAAISADGQTLTSGCSDVVTISIPQTNSLATNAPIVIEPPPQVALPVISPHGSANLPVDVILTCSTTNAAIFYTLDGTLPGTNSLFYTANAIHLMEQGVVRARAFLAGWMPSVAAAADFGSTIPPPNFGMDYQVETNLASAVRVTLRASPDSNQICAVIEEWIPPGLEVANVTAAGVFNPATGSIKWGPFWGSNIPTLSFEISGLGGLVSLRTRLSVDGRGNEHWLAVNLPMTGNGNGNDVNNVTIPTPPTPLPAPMISPIASTNLPVDVAITSPDEQAEIRYTMDGTVPGSNSALYSTALHLTADTVVRARAFRAGMTPSDTVFGDFRQVRSQTALGLVRGISGRDQYRPDVTITADPGTGVECYTITEVLPPGLSASDVGQNGVWNPVSQTIKWGPFFGGSRVLTYRLSGPSGAYSLTGTGSFDGRPTSVTGDVAVTVDLATMPQVAPVAFSPAPSGIFPADVTITCATSGAIIHYTLDGTIPTETSPVYAGPIRLPTVTLLSARAFKEWMVASPTKEVLFGNETLEGASSAMIVRTIAGDGFNRRNVMLAVRPVPDVLCYAVTEKLPDGLTPVDISGGGLYSPKSQTIRWGPFMGNETRFMGYRLTGPDGEYQASGSGSFNGYSFETSSDTLIRINNQPWAHHAVLSSVNGSISLVLTSQPPIGTSCYTVEEIFPPGIVPTNISDGGIWNSDTATIKWGPFMDDALRLFQFQVSGDTIEFVVHTRISVDGVSTDLLEDITPPIIIAYTTNIEMPLAGANCMAVVPDITMGVAATDNYISNYFLSYSQNPPVGAMVGPNDTQIVVTVSDTMGNYAACTTLVHIVNLSLPEIAAAPTNTAVLPGADALFTVTAWSCSGASYTWYFNDAIIPNENNPSLVLTNVAVSQEGAYWVMVSNRNGAVTSTVARLTVLDIVPPQIACLPDRIVGTTNRLGAPVEFIVTATDDRGPAIVRCVPSSGSVFPLGITTIHCTAIDTSSNISTCSFQVNVMLRQTASQVVNQPIKDNSPAGFTTNLFLDSPITCISNVLVSIRITNGYNGDLYAWLAHDSGKVVLLNRVGRTAAWEYGYGDSGFDQVTFDDEAANGDIHVYRMALSGNPDQALGGPLTGAWAPDGRTNALGQVLDSDGRTALLSSFKGLNAKGNWTLFIADVGYKDTSVLVDWSLDIYGSMASPVSTNAPLSIALSTKIIGGQMQFQVNAIAGRQYWLQFKDNLSATTWQELPAVPGINGWLILSDTPGIAPRRFYRIREE